MVPLTQEPLALRMKRILWEKPDPIPMSLSPIDFSHETSLVILALNKNLFFIVLDLEFRTTFSLTIDVVHPDISLVGSDQGLNYLSFFHYHLSIKVEGVRDLMRKVQLLFRLICLSCVERDYS